MCKVALESPDQAVQIPQTRCKINKIKEKKVN